MTLVYVVINDKTSSKQAVFPLTLTCVGLCGDGEARGTCAGKASHYIVTRMGAGRLECALIFI